MTARCLICCMATLVLASVGVRVNAEAVQEAEKKIMEAVSKHKSVMTKGKYKTEMKAEGFAMKSEGETLSEYKRKGEKGFMSRMESKSNDVRKVGNAPEEKSKTEVLQIYDGEFTYTLSITGEQKMAMKNKLDPKQNYSPFDIERFFKLMHEDHEVTLLKDEKVDGRDCYVFELKRKKAGDASPMMYGRMLQYYDKKTGITMKGVTYDKEGKEMSVVTTTEVKIDPDIRDDRFVFKAPEGVQVMDMTQLGRPDESEAASSDDTDKGEKETAGHDSSKEEEKSEARTEEKKEEKKGLGGLLNKLK